MTMNIALSGLNAAALDLSVTGNNIANVGTTGFKKSRAEFVDVYTASLGGVSKNTPGSGVRAVQVAQQFTQGVIEFTEQSLDLGISGEGFFVLSDNGSNVYTRSGAFGVDKEGFVVSAKGFRLQVFQPNGTTVAEGFSQGVLQDVKIDTSQGSPRATENVGVMMNLDARETPPTVTTFDPADPLSYNKSTSLTAFDSLGKPHIVTQYMVRVPAATAANAWDVYTYIDGTTNQITMNGGADSSHRVTFGASGALTSAQKVQYDVFDLTAVDPTSTATNLTLEFGYTGSTQYGSTFSVNELVQDGLSAGRLTGIDVSDEGIVFARYSNGGSIPMGQVAMARFNNPQGLSKLGDTNWAESGGSGEKIYGSAGSNNFGSIQSGALETANVDLAQQLVKLIVAQRNYQANAEVITTEDQVIQAVLNIK
ncbi:MAG: flagellar hook protein FlgE [Methylococcales bacterium]